MILRSKIKGLFSEEVIKLLASICDTRRIDSAHKKMELIQQLLKKHEIMFYTLGGATNRIALMIGGYTVKFALDRQGYKDNLMEYALSKELQPYVTKTYETNGYIVVAECVKLMTIEEWHLRKFDILKVLETLSQDYLLGDVGYIKKNFTNWGIRDDGSVVILDYAYCHRATENLFTCDVCGSGILRYDSTFSFLKCNNATVCTAKYDYTERKLIQGNDVDWEMIDDMKAESLMVPVGSTTIEVVDRDGIFKKGNIRVVDTPEEYYEYLRRAQKMGRNFDENEVLGLTIKSMHEKDPKKKQEIENQIAELMKSDEEIDGVETEVDWDSINNAMMLDEEEPEEEPVEEKCDSDYADDMSDIFSQLRRNRQSDNVLIESEEEPEGVEVPEDVSLSDDNIIVDGDDYDDALNGIEIGGNDHIEIPVEEEIESEEESVEEVTEDGVCNWRRPNGVNWDTDCGHTYFPYVKGFNQPNIYNTDKCPWCGKLRNEIEEEEPEEETTSEEEITEESEITTEDFDSNTNPGIYINGEHVSE